jgi:hypothetical protein
MKSFFLTLFLLAGFSSNAQWQQVGFIPQQDLLSMCPIGSYSANASSEFWFISPAKSFFWLYRDGCGGPHYSSEGKSYFTVDSNRTWTSSVCYSGGGIVGPNEPMYTHFEDTIVTCGRIYPTYYFDKSYNNGLTKEGFIAPLAYFALPKLGSMYNGNYGYGCDYNNGSFFLLDHDTCYQIRNYNKPTHWILFKFLSDSIGFAASSDTLLKTYDGGITWDTVLVDTSGNFTSLNFISDSIAFITKYIFPPENRIYRSIDKGSTWQIFNNSLGYLPNGFNNYNKDTLYGIYNPSYYSYNDPGRISYLMKSGNGGITWDSIPFLPGYFLTQFKMFSAEFGYVLAWKNSDYYIFQTNSGLVNIEDIDQTGLNVFPNPFDKKIFFKTKKDGIIKVMDFQGKIIYSEKVYSEIENQIELDVASGIYLICFNTDLGNKTFKIIKE